MRIAPFSSLALVQAPTSVKHLAFGSGFSAFVPGFFKPVLWPAPLLTWQTAQDRFGNLSQQAWQRRGIIPSTEHEPTEKTPRIMEFMPTDRDSLNMVIRLLRQSEDVYALEVLENDQVCYRSQSYARTSQSDWHDAHSKTQKTVWIPLSGTPWYRRAYQWFRGQEDACFNKQRVAFDYSLLAGIQVPLKEARRTCSEMGINPYLKWDLVVTLDEVQPGNESSTKLVSGEPVHTESAS